MYYVLTKLSDPGFIMGSSHYDLVCSAFEGYVCDECREEFDDLLESVCAEEFIIEEFESMSQWLNSEIKLLEEE